MFVCLWFSMPLSTIFQVQMYIVAVSVKEKKIRGHITGTKVVNWTL